MTRIAVLCPQVPFVEGGAEAHVRGLVEALRAAGHEAELVTLPYKWYPRDQLLAQPLLWRLVDLTESDGKTIDLVIGTKFPSYCALHPNKVVWLIHQFRQIYDLWGTPYSDFSPTPDDESVRDAIRRADVTALSEAKRVFTNARNTADRLRRFCGLEGEPLYHPPPLAPLLRAREPGEPGNYVLSVGRLDDLKRVDLLLEAAARVPRLRVKISGRGPAEERLKRRAAALGLGSRVEFLGKVPGETLADLYRGARAVYYAPFDEDFGYVTLEVFLAARPVVAASDSGGVLEFVADGESGRVVAPEPEAVAAALAVLTDDLAMARRLGEAGRARVVGITWGDVVRKLLEAGR